jgi:hypothetical protein
MAKNSGEVFTVQSILDSFVELPDPRSITNRVHLLRNTIIISLVAVIAGVYGPRSIGTWAKMNAQLTCYPNSDPGVVKVQSQFDLGPVS